MFLSQRNRFFSSLLTALVLLTAMAGQMVYAARTSVNESSVVVLTASWCATCREITPAVQRVIQSNPQLGLKLVTLDVDSNTAPNQAQTYGITVAGGDVPQVFLYNNGKTVLLFNGRGYKFGNSKQVERQIQQALDSQF